MIRNPSGIGKITKFSRAELMDQAMLFLDRLNAFKKEYKDKYK
jgi:hypothetical protein